jgi:hypothetical protein
MYILRVDPAPEIKKCDAFGDFDVYKDFTVLPPSSSPTLSKPSVASTASSKRTSPLKVRGIVVQYVDKTTSVKDANNKAYNTTASISAFTSNKVNYSNDKYLEYFTLKTDARSVYGDSFSTGAVVQYDQTGPLSYTMDDPEYNTYKTEGKISMVGENWFISADNKDYKDLLALGWVTETAANPNPANGLNYMPYSKDKYDRLKKSASSNILIHTVDVIWTFANPFTVVTSTLTEVGSSNAPIVSTITAVPEPAPKKTPHKGKIKKTNGGNGGRRKRYTWRIKTKRRMKTRKHVRK